MIAFVKSLGRLWSCTSGAALVEASLVVPLAASLMIGGMEFARAAANYLLIDKTMRGAARYLARVPPGAVSGWGLERARNLALRGTVDTSGSYVVSHWTDPNS